MNLTEALDVALPELPAKRALKTYPKLHPKLRWREHIEEGAPVIMTHIAGTSNLFRLSPEQWTLVQLFDGIRSYEDIAQAYQEQTGAQLGADDIRQFAEGMQESGFWYRTPWEQYDVDSRPGHKHANSRKKSRWSDVAHIDFSAWDPDAFLTRIHRRLKFLYSGWFTLLTLCLFSFMIYVFVGNWGEIGRDTLRFYNFTEKGAGDLVEFWLLFFALGFFHESAHGLTCKHYGGGVHRMGFQLLYLTPTFFVEVTEGWVYATRWQRLAIIIAGIWMELIFCALATIVWWGTAPSSAAHELAYKVMLITGVAVVVMNLNPLIKLDGYFFFCELIGVSELKERSTAFASGSIKRNLFALPVAVDYVPSRRAWLYWIYALASGVYSYLLLLVVVRFAYNVLRSFSPEWAFIPPLYLFYRLFRSRLRALVTFMKTVYLDKKERIRAWFTAPRLTLTAVAAVFLLFVPLRRHSIEGRFVLEPVQRAVIRAEVPGQVSEIDAREGSAVVSGATLARLRNLSLETKAAEAAAQLQIATARQTQAQMQYAGLGPAEQERQRIAQLSKGLNEQLTKLTLVSPVAGTVVTPRLHDLSGSYVAAGETVMEVADLSQMRARIYVPETALRDIGVGAEARVKVDARVTANPGRVLSITPASSDIDPGLVHVEEYKGIRPPVYYAATVLVANQDGDLLDGMAGTARIYSTRRSMAGLAWRAVYEFLGRKFW